MIIYNLNIEEIKAEAREFLGFEFENLADVVGAYEDEVTRIVKREIDAGSFCDSDIVIDGVMDSLFADLSRSVKADQQQDRMRADECSEYIASYVAKIAIECATEKLDQQELLFRAKLRQRECRVCVQHIVNLACKSASYECDLSHIGFEMLCDIAFNIVLASCDIMECPVTAELVDYCESMLYNLAEQ